MKHALGLVTRGRWKLTQQTLMSLFYSQQPKNSYDLYIIDNCSLKEDADNLRGFIRSGLLPVKNAYFLPAEATISEAWNLFLALTEKYDFRTKLDNDIVFRGTIPSTPKKIAANQPSPADSGPNPGSIPCGPPVKGAASSQVARSRAEKRRMQEFNHTRFLDHLERFMDENNVGVCALVPCPEQGQFYQMIRALSTQQFGGRPFLSGGCVMISKDTFDKLGFFDERIPRKIDLEYSQRAIRNKINIGYHPLYYVNHMDKGHTESDAAFQSKIEKSMNIIQNSPVETHCPSMWSKVVWKVLSASKNNKIIHLK